MHEKMLTYMKRRVTAALRSTRCQNDSATDLSGLLGLPQELLDMIVGYLDIDEVACLSVCNKNLHRKLEVDKWRNLRLGYWHDRQRKTLLVRLAHDNPALFFCHDCSYLHLVASVGRPYSIGYGGRLTCIKHRSERNDLLRPFDDYERLSTYQLTFSHVQLIMARHRFGHSHGIDVSLLAMSEVRRTLSEKVWALLSVEPRIIENELFLRVQQWTIFDQDDQPRFRELRGPAVCLHIRGLNQLNCQKQHIGERASCPP